MFLGLFSKSSAADLLYVGKGKVLLCPKYRWYKRDLISSPYPDLCFYYLSMKVHKELMTVVGKERLPKLSDQPYLPYTCAVVMETYRLASVMPFLLPHSVTKETMFMGNSLKLKHPN